MRYQYLLLLVIFICNFSGAQTQITKLENVFAGIKYTKAGIEKIDGVDYLFETNDNSLRVSIIDEELVVLYEVSDMPEDDTPSNYYGRMDTRSGYIVDGPFLYEVLTKQIRKRNLITGEIVNVFHFPNEEVKFARHLIIDEHLIHLEFGINAELKFYNTEMQELISLPYKMKDTYRENSIYYSKNLDKGITEYNAMDGSTKVLFENESSLFFGNNSRLSGQKGLIFGDFGRVRFLNKDTTFLLDCDAFDYFSFDVNVYDSEDQYFVFYNDPGGPKFIVKNKNNCSNLLIESYTSETYTDYPIKVLDSPLFNDQYVIYAINYRSFHENSLWLFNKQTANLTLIDQGSIMVIDEHSYYRSGEKIFFVGQKPLIDQAYKSLFSIDLSTQTLSIDQTAILDPEPISFAPANSDSTHLLTKNYDFGLSLYKFFNGNEPEHIYAPNDSINRGLPNIRYLAVEDEILVFKFNDHIYLANGLSNSTDDISLITNASAITDLRIKNNKIEGLVNYDSTTYQLNYDINSKVLSTSPLDRYFEFISNSTLHSDYFFGDYSIEDKLYFDLESGSFEPIEITENIVSYHSSNKQMLFVTECDLGYCLMSFIDGDFKPILLSYPTVPLIYSKQNGAFMIVEEVDENNSIVTIVESDATVGDQVSVEGKIMNNSFTEKMEIGPLSVLMFYNPQSLTIEIVVHRYQKMHQYSVPFSHANFGSLIWYKVGNSIILKSNDDNFDLAGIYICTIGKEAKKIVINEEGDRNLRLLFASHDNGFINFVINAYLEETEIVQYHLESEALNMMTSEYGEIQNSWYTTNPIFRISPSLYFVTFNYQYWFDSFVNSEIHIFDAENLTILPGKNLNNRYQQSDPHRFIESSTHLFFVARSPEDNSYQLYAQEKEELTSTIDVSSKRLKLNIHPNPSTNRIHINQDAVLLNITNINGQLVKSIYNHKKEEIINISDLGPGIYFIEAINNSVKSVGSFTKTQQ